MRDEDLKRYRKKWLKHYVKSYMARTGREQQDVAEEAGIKTSSQLSAMMSPKAKDPVKEKHLLRILEVIGVPESLFYSHLYDGAGDACDTCSSYGNAVFELSAFEASALPVVLTQGDTIADINPAFMDLWGITDKSRAVGRKADDLVPVAGEKGKERRKRRLAALRQGKTFRFKETFVAPGGRLFSAHVMAMPVLVNKQPGGLQIVESLVELVQEEVPAEPSLKSNKK